MVLLNPLVHCVLRKDIILLKDEDLEKKLENNTHQGVRGKTIKYTNIFNLKTCQTILLTKPMTEQMCMRIIQIIVSFFCLLLQT